MKSIKLRPVVGNQSKGFTVLELMIATLVFGVVLLLVSTGIVQIGRTYYKGVVSSRTQSAARAIVDNISQEIQFGGKASAIDTPPSFTGSYAICLGDNRFSVNLGQQLVENPANRALVADHTSSCGVTTPFALPSDNPRELLSPGMRVAVFTVCIPTTTPAAGCPAIPVSSRLYQIHVRVVYGDDDLLCSEALGCGASAPIPSFTAPDLTCKTTIGSQFCAVSDLNTTVQKRVE
jgi:prepilin-type N-terminal cleavage/methylation domain-containing protein